MAPRPSYSPLLDVLTASAVDATAAQHGWLLAVDGNDLVVLAGYGGDAPSGVGARGPVSIGWAGFAVTTRRPLALVPESNDPRFTGDLVVGSGKRPASLLCFPCSYQGTVIGALQLVDKAGGDRFSLDDVELVTWLAQIAGPAIDEAKRAFPAPPPDPAVLSAELRLLSVTDPVRYATIAGVVRELLLPG